MDDGREKREKEIKRTRLTNVFSIRGWTFFSSFFSTSTLIINPPTFSHRKTTTTTAFHNHSLSAERRDGSSGFTAGFILGGVVFGALGFLFAPQISSALLSDDQSRLKLPRFLDDADGADGRGGSRQPMTKQDLADRIAQLNSAIDDVSAQLRAQDEAAAAAAAGAEEGEAVTEVAA